MLLNSYIANASLHGNERFVSEKAIKTELELISSTANIKQKNRVRRLC